MSHDSLISSQIANRKMRIMIGFGLFLSKFERIVNSKIELVINLCYIELNFHYASMASVKPERQGSENGWLGTHRI